MKQVNKMIEFLSNNNCNVYNHCDKDISECKWSSDTGCLHPDHPFNRMWGNSKVREEVV